MFWYILNCSLLNIPKFGKRVYQGHQGTPASIVNREVMADTGEDDDEEAKVNPS